MFDAFLRERALRGRRRRSCRSTRVRDYDEYVDGKPRYDGVRVVPRLARDRAARGIARRPADAETVGGLGNRKNELVLAMIHRDGVEAYEGSVRFVQAVRDAGLRRAVVSSSANCREVLEAAGIADLFEARVDGDRRRARAPARESRRPTRSSRAARELGVEPATAAVFEDALAGVAAGRAGRFGFVVGVDRVGQADALRAHGADVVVSDLAELLDRVITHPAFAVEPWSVRETAPRPRRARADRVGVRALQRAHRAAREPRRGRAVRPARART